MEATATTGVTGNPTMTATSATYTIREAQPVANPNPGAGAEILTAASAGLCKVIKTVAELPISTYIKAGIFVGAAVFTAYVMISRIVKNRKVAKEAKEPCAFGAFNLGPSEMLNRKNYVGNPTIFDQLDPLTQEKARGCDVLYGKGRRKKSGKKKKLSRYAASKLAAALEARSATGDPYVDDPDLWGMSSGFRAIDPKLINQYRDEADEAARALGYPVDANAVND